MKVIMAKSAGFCFGVERAVASVYDVIEKGKRPIYTFGPIIHNEQVVGDLKEKGVTVINTKEELKKLDEGTVIIRSHGVPKEIYDIIRDRGLDIVDATCPFVKKIHEIVNNESNSGKSVIIVGNDKHPEVEGICGWVNGDYRVVSNKEQAEAIDIPKNTPLCIVSQTTFNYKKFQYLVEIIQSKGYNSNVVNTICNATHVRQIEAKEISSQVDAMIVIGGRHSSNTQKLYDICKEQCKNTYYIQTVEDLEQCELESFKSIGITAGASTPKNIIEEVHAKCQK